jgi:kinesin family protein C1
MKRRLGSATTAAPGAADATQAVGTRPSKLPRLSDATSEDVDALGSTTGSRGTVGSGASVAGSSGSGMDGAEGSGSGGALPMGSIMATYVPISRRSHPFVPRPHLHSFRLHSSVPLAFFPFFNCRYYGRAKKAVMDDLLARRNNAGKTKEDNLKMLLYKKQATILYLRDHMAGDPRATAIVDAEVEMGRVKGDLATASAKVADLHTRLLLRDKELADVRKQQAEAQAALDRETQAGRAEAEAARRRLEEAKARELRDALARAEQDKAEAVRAAEERLAGRLRADLAAVKIQAAQDLSAAQATHAAQTAQMQQQLQQGYSQMQQLQQQLQQQQEAMVKAAAELQGRLEASQHAAAELQAKLAHSEARRRKAVEENLSLKGSIRVFARVRPILPSDPQADDAVVAATAGAGKPLFGFPDAKDDASTIVWEDKPGAGVGGYGTAARGKMCPFDFQRVFVPTASNAQLFEEAEGVVQAAVQGSRVCIFAYGQTGAGKTHTMEGTPGERGLIPLSVEYVFAQTQAMAAQGWQVRLEAEMIEIYNENIRDLQARPGQAASSARMALRQDEAAREMVVPDVVRTLVASPAEVAAILQAAAANRSTGSTAMNSQSSRSHSVFTLRIHTFHQASGQMRKGLLHLIDLAGSERIAKSGVNDAAAGGSEKLLRETQSINKSLSALSKVISELQQKKGHVSYRDSVLTHLLQYSLGGDCKTLMICNLSPLFGSAQESLCTLRFAESVAKVATKIPAGAVAAPGASNNTATMAAWNAQQQQQMDANAFAMQQQQQMQQQQANFMQQQQMQHAMGMQPMQQQPMQMQMQQPMQQPMQQQLPMQQHRMMGSGFAPIAEVAEEDENLENKPMIGGMGQKGMGGFQPSAGNPLASRTQTQTAAGTSVSGATERKGGVALSISLGDDKPVARPPPALGANRQPFQARRTALAATARK